MDIPDVSISTQPLAFDDFKGGVTDYYINCSLDKYKTADNLLIEKHGDKGKLFSRPGSEVYDATYYRVPNNSRVGQLKYFESKLFVQAVRDLYIHSTSGWTTLLGPTPNNKCFPSTASSADVVTMTSWNKHLLLTSSAYAKPLKAFKDSGGTWQLRTAGLPDVDPSGIVMAYGSSGSFGNYLYAICYAYTYTVGTVTFIDRSKVYYTSVKNADLASGIFIQVPTPIDNGTEYLYATVDIVIELYRTVDGGSTFYFNTAHNLGVNFNDSKSDVLLVNGGATPILYTDGGTVSNGDPPRCKVVHVAGDSNICYYGNVKIGTEIYANRVYQSIPNDIDSVPASFFAQVEDDIVGISSTRSTGLIFGEKQAYRIDGAFDNFGGGGMFPTRIANSSGCASANGIVQIFEGVVWAGLDGFYFTPDGFTCARISDFDQTFAAIVADASRRSRIYGKYDPIKRRVYWAVQQADDATDVDACFVLDLRWGLSDSSPFTTISGGASFAPSAFEFVNGDMVRGDTRGYLLQHRSTLKSDYVIDTATAPANWVKQPVVYTFVSGATNFGTDFEQKFVPRISMVAQDVSNLSATITSINDDGRVTANLQPIRYRDGITWGDVDVYWGDPDIIWGKAGLIDEWRRFPAKNLRCSYKQIGFTNAETAIVSSDLCGTATLDGLAKTITLDNLVNTASWPDLSVGYVIAFETDGYLEEFVVSARTSDTVLTVTDLLNHLPSTANLQWVLRGVPKDETIGLLSYTLHYSTFGKTQSQFRSDQTGEVGS